MIEKRTAIELLAYLQDTSRDGIKTRWVHGEANLADSLTKAGAEKVVLAFLQTGTWSVVEDNAQKSAKKRRKEGLTPLQQEAEDEMEERDFNEMLYERLGKEFPEMFGDNNSEDTESEGWDDMCHFCTTEGNDEVSPR